MPGEQSFDGANTFRATGAFPGRKPVDPLMAVPGDPSHEGGLADAVVASSRSARGSGLHLSEGGLDNLHPKFSGVLTSGLSTGSELGRNGIESGQDAGHIAFQSVQSVEDVGRFHGADNSPIKTSTTSRKRHTVAQTEDLAWRMDVERRAEAVFAFGGNMNDAAIACGVSRGRLDRILKRFGDSKQTGDIMDAVAKTSTGRKPKAAQIDEAHLEAIRSLYARSNAGVGRGSMIVAALVYSRNPECPPDFQAMVEGWARSGHIPRSIRKALAVAPQTRRYFRSRKDLRLGTSYAPGTLRMTMDEESGAMRRLIGGERQNWDDASINFPVCVPWPWGGDPVSDRWGVKVGRFQLLAGLDDASNFCPGFSYIIRGKESYKGADATGAMLRCWREDVKPDEVVVEGGVWQSARAAEFYRLAGTRFISAKGRPNLKLIESYWHGLWTVLSCLADGQIGRWRGEMERENLILARVQSGSEDPRKHFPQLDLALRTMHEALALNNAKPVRSTEYGAWIPTERYAADLALHPRAALDPSISWLLAPVRADRKIQRGMIRASVPCPLGGSMPYHFVHASLFEFEGAPVTIYFDPWAAPIQDAVVVLAESFRGTPVGTIVTRAAECIDDAPVIGRADQGFDISFDLTGLTRAIESKKRYLAAARMEFRALKLDGKLQAWESETRAPDGSLTLGGMSTTVVDEPRLAARAKAPVSAEDPDRPRVRTWMDRVGLAG